MDLARSFSAGDQLDLLRRFPKCREKEGRAACKYSQRLEHRGKAFSQRRGLFHLMTRRPEEIELFINFIELLSDT